MKKPIPVGYEDLKQMIDKNLYYIDKTQMIKDLMDAAGKVNLFTRPRRFGKTLNLSMIRRFFELEMDDEGQQVDNGYLFDGLKKRDYYVAFVLLVLLDLLLIVGGRQGFYTTIGLIVNIALFYGMLTFYELKVNVLLLSIGLVVLFSAIVLVLINGFNQRTLISLCATLGAVAIIGLLSAAVIHFGPEISYEYMEYLPEPYTRSEANLLFLSEILIGGLGVIMDIAVTITSCSSELIRKDPLISKKALLLSCRQVADDITGTMINVVFFTNIAACVPVFIISMKNDISFFTVIKYHAFFEIARFLTGSIGIILTIPLAIFAASCFLKGGKRKCS